jgi:hypothetical protein
MIALDAARWLVERTIAWLNRCRRLAKDWENLNHKALTFLRLASIRLMLRKLCNPDDVPGRTLTKAQEDAHRIPSGTRLAKFFSRMISPI